MPSDSTVVATRSIVVTASIGYWPEALSADSITASAPSNTAVATSETSARVGTGVVIIDSSIWVAMTTGLPRRRARRVIVFCRPGTLLERHFDAEVAARHHHRVGDGEDVVETLDRLRLFDLGHHQRAIAGDRLHLDDVLGALDERQRDPVDALLQRRGEIGAVLFGHRRGRDRRVGQADALLVGDAAGDLDDRFARCRARRRRRAAAPCRRRSERDGRARPSRGFPDEADRRGSRRRASALASSVKTSPLRNWTPPASNSPTLSFGPCRSTRMPIGRSNSSSSERIIATRSRIASCEAWLMLMRKTSAPALNRLATMARSAEAGPRVAMILTRRLRRITNVLSFQFRLIFRFRRCCASRRSASLRVVN